MRRWLVVIALSAVPMFAQAQSTDRGTAAAPPPVPAIPPPTTSTGGDTTTPDRIAPPAQGSIGGKPTPGKARSNSSGG